MAFILRCIVTPWRLLFDAFMHQKLRRNPLYSDALYKTTSTSATRGVYNFYLLSFFAFCFLAWQGGLPWGFCLFLGISILASILIDRAPWSQKVSLRDMPRQLWRYLRLLVQAMRTELLVLVLASALVYGVIKPLTRPLDVFNGHTFLVLYGLYLSIRTIIYFRYLFIVSYRWDTYRQPPFSIRKANLRDQSAAARHLTWSFFLGNVGLVVRCGYYDMTVSLFDRLYSAVGYVDLRGVWGISLMAIVLAVWILLGDMRLGNPYYKAHRALHEDQALYVSVHRIHHYAVYPTVLDSGTINPAEFLLTESGTIWFAPLPDWFWFAFQVYMLVGHFEGHHTLSSTTNHDRYFQFHVLHHRLYQCNYGLPAMDEKYQTLVTWSEMEDVQPRKAS